MPVIFNRWIGSPLWDRVRNQEILADFDATFTLFIRALVEPLQADERILAWDLCNEPFINDLAEEKMLPVSDERETQWLAKVRDAVKQCDPSALVCIGTMPGIKWLDLTGDLQDVLTPHLYCPLIRIKVLREHQAKSPPATLEESVTRPELVKESLAFAKKQEKPMICTECCWGALDDDALRVRIIRENLRLLKEQGTGFMPHALWTSGVADLHKGGPGLNMPFILEDGSIRPGHELYNEFCR